MHTTRSANRLIALVSALLFALGLGIGTSPHAQARPTPPGGSTVTLIMINKTGWDLSLSGWPSTDTWGGSSSITQWIDPPAPVLPRGGVEVVRAWSANPAHMSASVTYSNSYRWAHWRYQSELSWALGFTTLGNTGASDGEINFARIDRFGAHSQATYVLG
ncbi:hypothetical protein ACWFOS_20215 [Gordonia terrae]|uniref:hypothetical protein n=1 Tax=Gordonia terrae TaxID=2055 RepID=UPI0021519B89|nr:hypothetical protein [Gordonia terrae]